MGRRSRFTVASLVLVCVSIVSGCSSTTSVSRERLEAVVQRDGVAFANGEVPSAVLDRLSESRVLVIGETHHLQEHGRFLADLLRELHASGLRQLLIERPQMYDWLLDDWLRGGSLAPEWNPPRVFTDRYGYIHDLNETLPESERIHVRSVDVNEDYYGGAPEFVFLLRWLVSALGWDADFIALLGDDYGSSYPAEQTATIEALRDALLAEQSRLTGRWGIRGVQQVREMLDAELRSIEIRAEEGDKASRLREDLIKQLVDDRLAETDGPTVINIGGHHAQKSPLLGTDQEWLGDYLVHRSPVAAGSVYVVVVRAARIELLSDAGGSPFDVAATSPENELLRTLAETWPGDDVFLPLNDPVFSEEKVAFNSEDEISRVALNEQFDAVLQYGVAHRIPEG